MHPPHRVVDLITGQLYTPVLSENTSNSQPFPISAESKPKAGDNRESPFLHYGRVCGGSRGEWSQER